MESRRSVQTDVNQACQSARCPRWSKQTTDASALLTTGRARRLPSSHRSGQSGELDFAPGNPVRVSRFTPVAPLSRARKRFSWLAPSAWAPAPTQSERLPFPQSRPASYQYLLSRSNQSSIREKPLNRSAAEYSALPWFLLRFRYLSRT